MGAAASPSSTSSGSTWPPTSAVSSWWIWYSANSEFSTSSSVWGRQAAICRQSSLPMLPPAPVMSTTLSCTSRCSSNGIGRHRLAAQQVFNFQLTHIVQAHAARGQVRHAGHGAHPHRQVPQGLQHLQAPLVGDRGQGEQQIGHAQFGDELRQRRWRVDRATVQAVAVQLGVVVQKAQQAVLGAAGECGSELAAGCARAVDQHAGHVLALAAPMRYRPPSQ